MFDGNDHAEARISAKKHTGEASVLLVLAALVITTISRMIAEFDIGPSGTAGLAAPFVAGSIIDIAISAWNGLWDDSDEVAWLEAEIEVIERLVDRFSGFAGVWIEDGDGNEIDVDDIAHPNAPDGGMDCVIVVDGGSYTEIGFQQTCTRVINIIEAGDY